LAAYFNLGQVVNQTATVQRFRASQANPVENARHKFQANQSRCFNPAIVSRSNRVAIQQ